MTRFLWPRGLQHARLPRPSLFPGVCSDSCLLSHWCYLTISSSATFFSFCSQSFTASGSFPMSWLFTSNGQSIGAVLPMNIQSFQWYHLGLTGLISLKSKRHSRVFSRTTFWKHQFFTMQPSLGFPGGSDGKESSCHAGNLGLIPGLRRSPGEGNGNPLQYFCLENSMDRGTWLATVHGVAKSQTRLSN